MAQKNRSLAAKADKARTQRKFGLTAPTKRWAEASVNGTDTWLVRQVNKAAAEPKPLATTRRERSLLRMMAAFR